jgi:hypothetical protein
MIVRVNQEPKVWLNNMISRGKREFFNLPSPIMITPEIAEAMLECNLPGNRTIRTAKIDAYVQAMQNGEWRVTAQGISFTCEGYLDNGQHRLTAVIASGCEVPMSVSFGQTADAYPTLDSGSARTAGDVLRYHGLPMATLLAATAGRVETVIVGSTVKRARRFSHQEILEMVERRPMLVEACRQVSRIKKLGGSPSAIACGLYFCLLQNETATIEMVDRLVDGIGLGWDSPIRVMREALIGRKYANSEEGQFGLSADVVNTFLAWRKGQKRRAKWSQGQPFPLAQ